MPETLDCPPVFASAILASNALRKNLGQAAQCNDGNQETLGAKNVLGYLVREKLIPFADEAERRPQLAKELPRSWLESGRSTS
jgi:hypothetical protein